MEKVCLLYVFIVLFAMTVAEEINSLTEDNFQSNVLAVQNAFCETPFNSTEGQVFATGNLTLDWLSISPPKEPSKSCCGNCSSDPNCVKTDTCCPDMLNYTSQVSTRTVCSGSQLRPYSDKYAYNYDTYLMLTGCSLSHDKLKEDDRIRRMCEYAEEYNNLDTRIPVTDQTTMAVYINRYCALCNGVLEESLIYWRPEILCLNSSLFMPDIDNIVTQIVESEDCNMFYQPPLDVSEKTAQGCSYFIQSCNVSGLWTRYDAAVDQACNAYTYNYDRKYKNVFCYFCNINADMTPERCGDDSIDKTDPKHKSVMVSFSAILRFRPKATTARDDNPQSNCLVNQLYDDYLAMCRNVSCYPPWEYVNGSCVNRYEEITGVKYRFYIKLIPVRTLIPEELDSMVCDIYRFFKSLSMSLNLLLENLLVRIFSHYSLLALGKSTSFLKQFTGLSDQEPSEDTEPDIPEYYLIQMDIDIPARTPVKSSFIEMILLFEGDTISLENTNGYVIDLNVSFVIAELHKVDDLMDILKESVSDDVLREHRYDDENVEPVNSTHDFSREPESIGPLNRPRTFQKRSLQGRGKKAQEDSSDSNSNPVREENLQGINASFQNEDDPFEVDTSSITVLEILTPTHLCPLISLPNTAFEIVKLRWGIHVKRLNVNISRSKYLEMPSEYDNDTVFVCKTFYKEIIKHQLLEGQNVIKTKPSEMLSLICMCLSVFCSVLTLVTYALFVELRTQPGINNIMLICSLICAQILFQFGIGQAQNVPDWFCKSLGIMVHFSWLVTLMWMNVCSLHMFRVFRSIERKIGETSVSNTTFKYSIYCISVAMIPVCVNATYNKLRFDNIGYGGVLCYISSFDMIGYLFVVPVGLIVLVNLCLFLAVIITISKLPKIGGNMSKNRNFATIYIKISSLTGITWIFGFIFAFTNIELFEYIFIILNSSLGVFIFLSFSCNKRVLKLYSKLLFCENVKSKYSESTNVPTFRNSSDRKNQEVVIKDN